MVQNCQNLIFRLAYSIQLLKQDMSTAKALSQSKLQFNLIFFKLLTLTMAEFGSAQLKLLYIDHMLLYIGCMLLYRPSGTLNFGPTVLIFVLPSQMEVYFMFL